METENKIKDSTKKTSNSGTGCLALTMFGIPILIGLLLIVLGLGWYVYSSYNKLVESNQIVGQSWSDVENIYQKRLDLVSNLVATVKGYASHENNTLVEVTEARAKASSIQINAEDLNEETLTKFEDAQNQVSGSLSRLLVSVENYPELKADKNFMDLQNELKNIETEIASRREVFNISIKQYNLYVLKFPRNIIANIFNFKEKPYFKADPEALKAPKVSFE